MDLGKLANHSVPGAIGYALVILALFGLYACAFRRCLAVADISFSWILGAGLLFAFTAVWVHPIGALDIFDNIFYGRMMVVYNANPLLMPPAALPDDPLYPYVAWYWWPVPYGPLWALADGLVVAISGGGLLPSLLAFKFLNLGLYLVCTLLIAAILRRQWPAYTLAGTLSFAWNPLLILEGMANAHNDLALLAFLLLALYLYHLKRWLLGLAALLASVLVKYITLPLVPLYLLATWRQGRNGRFLWGAAGLLALAAIALYAPYYVPGQPLARWLMLPFRQADLFTTSLPAMAAFLLERVMEPLQARALIRGVALAGWGGFTLVQAWRLWQGTADFSAIAHRVIWYYLVFACLWFQPWYAVWLVATGPLLGSPLEATSTIFFAALVHVKYLIYDFIWFWRQPPYEAIVPETATTILIFGPMLFCSIRAWRIRRLSK